MLQGASHTGFSECFPRFLCGQRACILIAEQPCLWLWFEWEHPLYWAVSSYMCLGYRFTAYDMYVDECGYGNLMTDTVYV